MKTLPSKNTRTYAAVFEPAEEGGYIVSVPALPGCVTQGESFEEAQMMIQDAIQGYLMTRIEEGLEIPPTEEEAITSLIKVAVPTV